jgi:hypothetical protein
MFTYHSTQFQLNGFLLVLSASLLGGLRWTLSQLVMQRKEVGENCLVYFFYTQIQCFSNNCQSLKLYALLFNLFIFELDFIRVYFEYI